MDSFPFPSWDLLESLAPCSGASDRPSTQSTRMYPRRRPTGATPGAQCLQAHAQMPCVLGGWAPAGGPSAGRACLASASVLMMPKGIKTSPDAPSRYGYFTSITIRLPFWCLLWRPTYGYSSRRPRVTGLGNGNGCYSVQVQKTAACKELREDLGGIAKHPKCLDGTHARERETELVREFLWRW